MFLLAGVPKLVMSAAQMATAPGPIQLPVAFIRFIGVCEILGAIGMIVPGLTGIRPGLTPLAAGGLVIIMIGATRHQHDERHGGLRDPHGDSRAAGRVRRLRCAERQLGT